MTSSELEQVKAFALGLGGWKVDPADPWKAPYSPDNAALAAAEVVSLRTAQNRSAVTLTESELEEVAALVKEARDSDPRDPADYQ